MSGHILCRPERQADRHGLDVSLGHFCATPPPEYRRAARYSGGVASAGVVELNYEARRNGLEELEVGSAHFFVGLCPAAARTGPIDAREQVK